jgi:hypothetical protein
MNRSVLTGIILLAAAGCAGGGTKPALLAYGGPAAGRIGASASGSEVNRVPEEVLRNPVERMTLVDQMRRQIVYKTRTVPEDRYRTDVRPRLARQLQAAGFASEDVAWILSDVDYSRSLR